MLMNFAIEILQWLPNIKISLLGPNLHYTWKSSFHLKFKRTLVHILDKLPNYSLFLIHLYLKKKIAKLEFYSLWALYRMESIISPKYIIMRKFFKLVVRFGTKKCICKSTILFYSHHHHILLPLLLWLTTWILIFLRNIVLFPKKRLR